MSRFTGFKVKDVVYLHPRIAGANANSTVVIECTGAGFYLVKGYAKLVNEAALSYTPWS